MPAFSNVLVFSASPHSGAFLIALMTDFRNAPQMDVDRKAAYSFCRVSALSLILRKLEDLVEPKHVYNAGSKENHKLTVARHKKAAHAFFFMPNDLFEVACDIADLDHDAVRTRAKRYILEKTKPPIEARH